MKVKYTRLKEKNILSIHYIHYDIIYYNINFDFKLVPIIVVK